MLDVQRAAPSIEYYEDTVGCRIWQLESIAFSRTSCRSLWLSQLRMVIFARFSGLSRRREGVEEPKKNRIRAP